MNKVLLKTSLLSFFAALLILTGCEKKEDIPLDPRYTHCGLGGMFMKDPATGECNRCRTEAGMIRTGRDGQLCWNPSHNPLSERDVKMVLFDTLPVAWWPSDTLYLTRSFLSDQPGSSGVLTTLGTTPYDNGWVHPNCTESPDGFISGLSIRSLRTSNGDAVFDEGELFSFTIIGAEYNNDCYEDWGHVSGRVQNDTAKAVVEWMVMQNPPELRRKTLGWSRLIMVDPPDWVMNAR